MVVGMLRIQYAEKDGESKLKMDYDILKREDANDIELHTATAIESLLLGAAKHVAQKENIPFKSRVIKSSDKSAAAFPWRDRDLSEVVISDFEEYGITESIAAAYLNSLNQHIAYVRQAGQIIGVPRDQLHHHDQSKFGLEEFPYYARNFFGDKGDPDGWEKAWLHHENHNPHHWGHWIARSGKMAGKPLPMPMHYVQEMVADWHGAGKAYQGSWNISSWVSQQGPGFTLHPETERLVDEVMHSIGYVLTDNCMWSYMAGHKFYELFDEPAPGEVE